MLCRSGFSRPASRRGCRPKFFVFGSLPKRRTGGAGLLQSGVPAAQAGDLRAGEALRQQRAFAVSRRPVIGGSRRRQAEGLRREALYPNAGQQEKPVAAHHPADVGEAGVGQWHRHGDRVGSRPHRIRCRPAHRGAPNGYNTGPSRPAGSAILRDDGSRSSPAGGGIPPRPSPAQATGRQDLQAHTRRNGRQGPAEGARGSSIVASVSGSRTPSFPASPGRSLRAEPRHGRPSGLVQFSRSHYSRACADRVRSPPLQAVPNHSTVSEEICRMPICMAA